MYHFPVDLADKEFQLISKLRVLFCFLSALMAYEQTLLLEALYKTVLLGFFVGKDCVYTKLLLYKSKLQS